MFFLISEDAFYWPITNKSYQQRPWKLCTGLAVSEEIFQKSTNQKQELPIAAMFVNRSGRNEQSLQITFHIYVLNKLRFIWSRGFRVEHFQKLTNQKKELPIATMCVNVSGRNEQSLQRTFNKCFGSFSKAKLSGIRGED